jgi:hypothetical protein
VGVCSTLSCDSSDVILPTHPATDEPGSRNVILLRKRSDARIGRFLDDQRSLPFSYPEVFAFARPAHPLAREGPPFVQLVQRRFAAASRRAMAAAHHSTFQFPRGCRTPFRKPLQFIVIAVMSVMSGTFPDTNGVFYVTINS